MAFVDGELDPAEHARIAAAIAERPDLAARVAVFTATGRKLGELFDAQMRDPVPQELIDLLMSGRKDRN